MLNNFVDALGDIIFFDYSHEPSRTSVDAFADTLAETDETIAEAEAEAFFANSGLSELISQSTGASTEGAFAGSAASETQIVASFSVEAGDIFSFDFSGDLFLEAKEIENPDAEYNEAQLNLGFLLLDTSDINHIKLLDYATFGADLITSEQIGNLDVHFSDHFTLNDDATLKDVDGNNEIDFISSAPLGTYERTFDKDTDLTLLKVNETAVAWLGDTLLGNLGLDFTYGTLWDDLWFGSQQNDSYYGSLGDDRLFSQNGDDIILAGLGDDTIYAGNGDDRLEGGSGNDILSASNGDDELLGGSGDDILKASNGDDRLAGGLGDDILRASNGNDELLGGSGDDILTGGFGIDEFIYETSEAFNSDQVGVDLITDLTVNTDQLILSQNTFTSLSATLDNLIDPNEFEVVTNDNLAAISKALITYSRGTGNLFYNQNGSEEGWGEGEHFATLQNIPTLSATDIRLI